MDTIPSSVRTRIQKYLPAARQPRLAIQNSCSKTGDAGESWLIATESHLLVGSQDLTGDMEFTAHPLRKITGIERDGHGFGRGKLVFLSGTEALDRLEYSALDSTKFESVDQEILSLVRAAGGRPAAPTPAAKPETGTAGPGKEKKPLEARPPSGPQPAMRPPAPPPARETPGPPNTREKPPGPPRRQRPTPTKTAPASTPAADRKTPRPKPEPLDAAKTVAIPKTPARALPKKTVAVVPVAPEKKPALRKKKTPPPAKKTTPEPPKEEKKVPLERVGGSGSSSVVILLPSSSLHPGRVIPAHVGVRRQKDIACRGVRLHLRGLEETRITHGMGKNRSTSRERRVLIDEEHVLFGKRSRPAEENFADALGTVFSSGRYPVLRAGNHVWDARLYLPTGSLPSYDGRHGSVTYSLKAYVDVPRAFDIAKIANITISPEEESQRLRFAPVRRGRRGYGPRDLQVHIEMDEFEWGEDTKIRGTIRFSNPKRREIRGIRVDAYYQEQAVAEGEVRRTKVAAKRSFSRLGFTGTEFPTRGFGVPAPARVPLFAGKHLRTDLCVTVTLDLPWEADVKFEYVAVPVSGGE
jgi:hypothetical protein